MNISCRNDSLNPSTDVNGLILYRGSEVNNCTLNVPRVGVSIIGDFSLVKESVLGNHIRIDRNNFVTLSTIGDYSYTGRFDMIFRSKIGKFTSISYGVTIGPPEHNYRRLTQHPFILKSEYGIFNENEIIDNDELNEDLIIGNDVWIGCNSTILRGVEIGDGAIVGANSVVTKDVPPYAIVVGCPANIIKYRFNRDQIKKLLEIKWWEWDIETIRKNKDHFMNLLNTDNLNMLHNDKLILKKIDEI